MSLCTDGLGGSSIRWWSSRRPQGAHLGLISGGVPRQRPPCWKQLDRNVGKQSLKAAVTDRTRSVDARGAGAQCLVPSKAGMVLDSHRAAAPSSSHH
jgi:hypothetical protein